MMMSYQKRNGQKACCGYAGGRSPCWPKTSCYDGPRRYHRNLPENNEWQKFKGRVSLASFI